MNFLDGPAAFKTLDLRRAPLLLRVVIDADGAIDALDQLADAPKPTETIHVYRRVGRVCTAFIDYTDRRGRRCGHPFRHADYRLHDQQPGDEETRDAERWQAWCRGQQLRSAKRFVPQPTEVL